MPGTGGDLTWRTGEAVRRARENEWSMEVRVSDNVNGDISLNEQKQLIVQYAQENGSVTRKEVEELLNKH